MQYIKKITIIIGLCHVFVDIILFSLLVYYIYNFNYLFTSFLKFIAILPSRFLSKDEKFIDDIMIFGDKYF